MVKYLALGLCVLTIIVSTTLGQQDHEGACKTTTDCVPDKELICKPTFPNHPIIEDGKCLCTDNRHYETQENLNTCVRDEGSICSAGNTDCASNSQCAGGDGRCICNIGFGSTLKGNKYCVGLVGTICRFSTSSPRQRCNTDLGLTCELNFADPENLGEMKCRCPNDKVWSDARKKCFVRTGHLCTNNPANADDSCTENSRCSTGSTCQCLTGFSSGSDGKCYANYLQPCQHSECNPDHRTECKESQSTSIISTTTLICDCPINTQYTSGSCRSLVGEKCENSNDCFDNYCHFFTPSPTANPPEPTTNDPTNPSTIDSSPIESSPIESSPIESSTIGSNTIESSTIGSNTIDSSTIDITTEPTTTNAVEPIGICLCRPPIYLEMQNKTCGLLGRESEYGYNQYCLDDTDCDGRRFYICNKTVTGQTEYGRCVCANGFVHELNQCRIPVPGGPCILNRNCIQNAVCREGTCQCNQLLSSQGPENKCYLNHDQFGCTDQNPCRSDLGLECRSSICRCPFGQIWSNPPAGSNDEGRCAVLVAGNCTESLDRCYNHSHCTKTGICKCDDGYVVDSYDRKCHPSDGMPCSAINSCIANTFLTCDDSVSGKCTCLYPLSQIFDKKKEMCVSVSGGFCGYLVEHQYMLACADYSMCTADFQGISRCVCTAEDYTAVDGEECPPYAPTTVLVETTTTAPTSSSGRMTFYTMMSIIYLLSIMYLQ